MDRARIHDLEGLYSAAQCRVDELDGQIDALLNGINDRDWKIRELEAHLAAMREALQSIIMAATFVRGCSIILNTAQEALTPDAGRDLLERLRKAEAERVTPLNREQLWQYVFVNTGVGVDELDGIIEYLILNDHIREAE